MAKLRHLQKGMLLLTLSKMKINFPFRKKLYKAKK